MPIYKKEINRLIELDEVKQMLNKCKIVSHQVVIAILYLTGARPIEIVNLEKNNIKIVGEDLHMDLITVKKGLDRILPFSIEETPFIKDLVIPYVERLSDPEDRLFKFRTVTRIKQIVYYASDNILCPYNFRHNRLSRLGLAGASAHELMYWKGAKDLKSVSAYLYRNPSVLNRLKNQIQ